MILWIINHHSKNTGMVAKNAGLLEKFWMTIIIHACRTMLVEGLLWIRTTTLCMRYGPRDLDIKGNLGAFFLQYWPAWSFKVVYTTSKCSLAIHCQEGPITLGSSNAEEKKPEQRKHFCWKHSQACIMSDAVGFFSPFTTYKMCANIAQYPWALQIANEWMDWAFTTSKFLFCWLLWKHFHMGLLLLGACSPHHLCNKNSLSIIIIYALVCSMAFPFVREPASYKRGHISKEES